jgi:hypothetical protein
LLVADGLFAAWGVARFFAAPGWDKGVQLLKLLLLAGVLLVPAVACIVMALAREPSTRRKHSAAGKDQEDRLPEKDVDTRLPEMANQSSGDSNQLPKLTEAAPAVQQATQSDQSTAKHERQHREEPSWLTWFIWGGLLGGVLSMVAGAIGGAIIAATWVEGGAFAYVLGAIGAVVGAIIAAPVGVVLGWIIGATICELLVPAVLFLPLLIAHEFRDFWGTRIGSFVASPNPVTPGGTTTLTASKITVANRGATVARVAFYAHINGKQTLLGYGTQTTPDIWTLNLTVTLAAGSYFLHARARDSGGASGVSRPLRLTVGVGVDWSALRHG